MGKIDVASLTEPQATLLMPLWARAEESRREHPILRDDKAAEIVAALDYDFDLFKRKSVPQADYCIRVAIIDRLVSEFLATYPRSTIVELGVGLDSRYERLDNGQAAWIAYDLPAVIALRKQFFPASDRRWMVSGSLLDEQWQQPIANLVAEPVLFVAEGVFYFFNAADVRKLVASLINLVPSGHLVFDAQSPLFLLYNNLRHPLQDSRLTFALGSPRGIAEWDSRLRIEKYVGFGDLPYYQNVMHRVAWPARWGRRLFKPCRHLFKMLQVGW